MLGLTIMMIIYCRACVCVLGARGGREREREIERKKERN